MKLNRTLQIFTLCTVVILTLSSAMNRAGSSDERWKAPAWADSLESPYITEPLTLPLGEELYVYYCASCHGENGKGFKGTQLSGTGNMNLLENEVTSQTNGALFWKISEGRKSMPSFKDLLSEEQRWQLVAYLRDIAKPFEQQENPFKKPQP